MNDGVVLAQKLFQNVVGMKPTRVRLGVGSFITMDFGKDIPQEVKTRQGMQTRYFGEWHLWVYMCTWHVEKETKQVADCEDEREKIEQVLKDLATRRLSHVTVLNDAFDIRMEFEEIVLHLVHREKEKQWMLFTPKNKTFVAGPGKEWSYRDS